MEAPAHRRTERVCVPPDTEAPPADASVLQGSMVSAAVSPVLSVSIAMVLVTTSQDTVSVCQDSVALCVTKCVPVAGLGKAVQSCVCVVTTGPVTPSMAPVSVTQDGSERTALRCVLRVRGVQTASIPVTVTMGLSASLQTDNVAAAQGGADCTVHNVVVQGSLVPTAPRCVGVRTERTVTTSLVSAPVGLDSSDTAVNSSVVPVRLATAVSSCVCV